ncbi:hypothetical protein Tco_0413459 [Tanacetum coccineum]
MLEEERETLDIAERARLLAEFIDKKKKIEDIFNKTYKQVQSLVPMESEAIERTSELEDREDLQQMMMIVPVEVMNIKALQTKYPIIDWEVYTDEMLRKY